ncbi:hypothetical protein FFLO_06159 [Filobasidium floriforme]|uniref:Pheromone receptor n=1 Tax=Filobasidium floriforme TaxID=5210 RepID=A0A8K0JFF8_9TREE|nr:hypothetical protein FFLO_06159 [Filobasidium floriforme]
MSEQYIFAFFSAISIPLVLLPSAWHWRSRNTGTLLYIGWVLVANITYFLNTVIWWDNTENLAPVWCDICIKLQIGIAPGLLSASLCINRRLALISLSKSPSMSRRAARMNLIIELCLGLGLPAAIMAASYVVQPHRFDIAEGLGCFSQPYPVLAAVFLVLLWPVLLSFVSSGYVVAVSSFIRRRLQFSTFLKTNQSGLTTSRYLRLVALATSDLLISLPLAIFYLVEFTQHLSPWISFDWIHLDFHVVNAFDSTYMARNPDIATRLFLPRWLAPLSAIAFFAFFGLAEDALADYVSIYERIRSYIVRPSQLRNARIGQM